MKGIQTLLVAALALVGGLCSESCAAPTGQNNGLQVSTASTIARGLGSPKQTYLVVKDSRIQGDMYFFDAASGSREGDYPMVYIDCEIVFINCVFEEKCEGYFSKGEGKGAVSTCFMRHVTFERCNFLKGFNMQGCIFEDGLNMDGSVVRGETNLMGTEVRGAGVFNKVMFDGETNMSSSQFGSMAAFAGAWFQGNINMQFARFINAAIFTDCKFEGHLSFSNVLASGTVDMTNARYGGRVECVASRLMGGIRLASASFTDNVTFEENLVSFECELNTTVFGRTLTVGSNTFLCKVNQGGIKEGTAFNFVRKDNYLLPLPGQMRTDF